MMPGRWTETGFIPVTIGAMVACIALSLATLLERAVPGWNGGFVVAFCSLTAVEAAYSYRLYRCDLDPGPRRVLTQALELVTLCVLRQVGQSMLSGHAPLQGGAPRFEARYSNHEVGPAQLDRARASWRRARSALRSVKRE